MPGTTGPHSSASPIAAASSVLPQPLGRMISARRTSRLPDLTVVLVEAVDDPFLPRLEPERLAQVIALAVDEVLLDPGADGRAECRRQLRSRRARGAGLRLRVLRSRLLRLLFSSSSERYFSATAIPRRWRDSGVRPSSSSSRRIWPASLKA